MDRTPIESALSTDVVMDIVLNHLKVRDLLNCRKISKFWNTAASSVLRRRSTMIKTISSEAELMELKKCMKQNSDFPFTGFQFNQSWMLNCPRAKQFFQNYGEKFTSLYVVTSMETRVQEEDLAPFCRLSILEMIWPAELSDSAAGQKGGRILNLPSLLTLRVSSEFNQDGLGQVLKAASPSLRIECWPATYGVLRQLKSVGKFQAVSFMKVNFYGKDEGEDNTLRVVELLSTDSPVLTKLMLCNQSLLTLDWLIKLLISSRHTLKELHLRGLYPSEFSSECPVLTELTSLSLHGVDEPHQYVFQGSQGHKFPALQELKIHSLFAHMLSDGLFIVPSAKKMVLLTSFSEAGIEKLARSFPNVIEIQLDHFLQDFGCMKDRSPLDIWSVGAFKLLEKLVIRRCNVKWPTCKSYVSPKNLIDLKKFKVTNMDSFLTGIPITICENLRKHNQKNLKGSSFSEILRDSPNILQLKKLKQLIVSVELDSGDKWEELTEEPPFISMVSFWYALEMIPNLETRFVYEPNSLTAEFGVEDRNKAFAMLKAAFKHVQPYVELEPFFY